MDRSLLTSGDVAEVLGVAKSWVYEQSRARRIHTVTLGRARRLGIQAAA
jgi:predicted DNA-binding transcriptional regulator AlpA